MKPFGHSGRPPRPNHLPEARGEKRPAGSIPPVARKPAIMQEPVLVLNATFEPINVTAVRRAMVLMIKGVAQAETAPVFSPLKEAIRRRLIKSHQAAVPS